MVTVDGYAKIDSTIFTQGYLMTLLDLSSLYFSTGASTDKDVLILT